MDIQQQRAAQYREMCWDLYNSCTSLQHHGVHREDFIDIVGPPNQTNCLRLEHKHQPFKQYTGQIYWDRILLTLAERVNMTTAHEFYLRSRKHDAGGRRMHVEALSQ